MKSLHIFCGLHPFYFVFWGDIVNGLFEFQFLAVASAWRHNWLLYIDLRFLYFLESFWDSSGLSQALKAFLFHDDFSVLFTVTFYFCTWLSFWDWWPFVRRFVRQWPWIALCHLSHMLFSDNQVFLITAKSKKAGYVPGVSARMFHFRVSKWRAALNAGDCQGQKKKRPSSRSTGALSRRGVIYK